MGQAICYDAIGTSIAKGNPWWAPFVMDFTSFLGRHAGGMEGENWKWFQAFHAHCIQSNERQMPGYMWRDLAEILEPFFLCRPSGSLYLLEGGRGGQEVQLVQDN